MPSYPEQSVVAYVVGVRLGQLESLRTTWEHPVTGSQLQRLPSLIRVHLVQELLPRLQELINTLPKKVVELNHKNILELTRGVDHDLAAIQFHSIAHVWNDGSETKSVVDASVRESALSLRGHLVALKRNIRELLVAEHPPRQYAGRHWLDLGWEICRAGCVPLDDIDQEARVSLPAWAHDDSRIYSWVALNIRELEQLANTSLEEIIPPIPDETSSVPVVLSLVDFLTDHLPATLWYRVEAGIAQLQLHANHTRVDTSGVDPLESCNDLHQAATLQDDEKHYGYLGLAIDETNCLVRRKGYDEAVDFSRNPLPLKVLIKLLHNRGTPINDEALFPLWYDFGITAFPGTKNVSDATRIIKKLLEPLKVEVKKIKNCGRYLKDLAAK